MQIFDYEFVRNAFAAIMLITPLFGLIGTMIVNNKLAFFSDALGHSAITGIALGVILGVSNTTFSMVLFGIVFALLLNWIKYRGKAGAETIISVFASCGLAIGLAVLSSGGNFSKYNALLIGDILSITKGELVGLLCVFLVTVVFWLCCFNQLHFVSINPSLAQSKGISVRLYDNLFVVLLAVIVMLSIRWVGLLIINALLILPAAAARNVARNMRSYHLLSVLFAIVCGVGGLLLSCRTDIATGPMIVLLASAVFFLTLCKKR
ncbi:MAG: metal ABC transporter permease [Eubacteriales bacterium]|nr:metal ABC transporter permease [Eubacteriales bacterium]